MDQQKIDSKKQAMKERLMKKIAQKRVKNIQPGECMKFIQVDIDEGIRDNFDFYEETVMILESASASYSINSSLLTPNNSITWTRIIEEYSIDDRNKLTTAIKKEHEKYVLIIWKWDQVVKQIYDKIFTTSFASMALSMPEIKITLVIYGMEQYFEHLKRHANKRNKKLNKNNEMKDIPKISRRDFELSLIDIQLDVNCNTRLIENAADMSLLIYQFTKAIAEKTYKSETNNKVYDQIDFFATGDNKKTVKVDSYGYGLKKLWLKQLCMFNTSNLAAADAICAVYSSPSELINSYINSSTQDSDVLLKNIEIKRAAAGHFTKIRKLGPELSRKIHTMYTSTNGEQLLT